MKTLGYLFASLLIILSLAIITYVGMTMAPLFSSSILFAGTSGELSFIVEGEAPFRIGNENTLRVGIQEIEGQVMTSGHINFFFEPGTTFTEINAIESSQISIIASSVDQSSGTARIEMMSPKSEEPRLLAIADVTISPSQVPVSGKITIGIEGMISDDSIPPKTFPITYKEMTIPVLFGATERVGSEGKVVAECAFGTTEKSVGSRVAGTLLINAPQAVSASAELLYEPEYMRVANVKLNDTLVSQDIRVNPEEGTITVSAISEGVMPNEFAHIDFELTKSVQSTGVSVSNLLIKNANGEEILTTEQNDPSGNITITERIFTLEGEAPAEDIPEETREVKVSLQLEPSCDIADLDEIAGKNELSEEQVQSIATSICSVIEAGMMSATDGMFRPQAALSRAELAKIVSLLVWDEKAIDRAVKPYINGEKSFSRVYNDFTNEEQSFYRYVVAAKVLGLLKGYSDGTFRAEETLTRAEVVSAILEAMAMQNIDISMRIARNTTGDAYQKYLKTIEQLFGKSLLITLKDLNEKAPRAEVAELLSAFLSL